MKRWIGSICVTAVLACTPFLWIQFGQEWILELRLSRVQVGMSVAETEEILGPGKKFHATSAYIAEDGTIYSIHEHYSWRLPALFQRDTEVTVRPFRGITVWFVDGHVTQKQFFK